MRNVYTKWLFLIAGATQKELARQVQYLKIENQILRSKLPSRVPVTDAAAEPLAKLSNLEALDLQGSHLSDEGIAKLAALTNLKVLYVGGSEERGSPITDASIDAVRNLAKLQQLGIQNTQLSPQGVRSLCELPKLTLLEVSSSSLTEEFRDEPNGNTEIFGFTFRVPRLIVTKPAGNAIAERWVQSIKQERLDHFIVFGEKHLRHIVSEYVKFHNEERLHQGVGNTRLRLIGANEPPPESAEGEIVCASRLGWLLKHYCRRAA